MSRDPNKLGIFMTSPQHMRHCLGVAKAAVAAGKDVKVFFTFKGVHNTKSPLFVELCNLLPKGNVKICAASYQCEGYCVKDVPKGITGKDMGTQSAHGTILEEVGKYLTL